MAIVTFCHPGSLALLVAISVTFYSNCRFRCIHVHPCQLECNFNWHWWQIKCGTRQQLQVCVFLLWSLGCWHRVGDGWCEAPFGIHLSCCNFKMDLCIQTTSPAKCTKVLKFCSFSQISHKLKNCARIRDWGWPATMGWLSTRSSLQMGETTLVRF